MKCGLPPSFDFEKFIVRILICAGVGIVIGLGLGLIMAIAAS